MLAIFDYYDFESGFGRKIGRITFLAEPFIDWQAKKAQFTY